MKETNELQQTIAGALFDFAARLTTLRTPITLGANQAIYPIIDLLNEWANERGLSLNDANVTSWTSQLSKTTDLEYLNLVQEVAKKAVENFDEPDSLMYLSRLAEALYGFGDPRHKAIEVARTRNEETAFIVIPIRL